MGYTTVNLHVKVNTIEDEYKVKKYFEINGHDTNSLMDEVPEEFRDSVADMLGITGMDEQMGEKSNEFVSQPGYLSICSDKVRFDNFEMVAEDLSEKLGFDVLVALVFDSDVAVIEGFSQGRKILEEVNSLDEKKKMDRKAFIKRFAPNCTEEQIASVWDKEIDVFAENILFEMGEVMGIELLMDSY